MLSHVRAATTLSASVSNNQVPIGLVRFMSEYRAALSSRLSHGSMRMVSEKIGWGRRKRAITEIAWNVLQPDRGNLELTLCIVVSQCHDQYINDFRQAHVGLPLQMVSLCPNGHGDVSID